MESWLGIPILYFLLLFSQLISANDSSSAASATSHDAVAYNANPGLADHQREILRFLLMAAQSNKSPSLQFRGNSWGIPYRPVRRMGSEFLGKRSDIPPLFDEEDEIEKRAMGSEFLGKRGMGSEFLGKRGMGSEFLGKRGMGSEFLGKRAMGSEFLGKRAMGSEFLGKRAMGSEFLGKRAMGSEFLGKRGMGSEFLGKRGMGSEFLGKRGMGSEFLGKRGMGSEFLGKRGMGSEFLGKRAMGSEFLGKRAMGSEFLGKRNMGSEFLGKRDYLDDAQSELPELSPIQQHPHPDNLYMLVAKRAMGSEFLGKRKPSSAYDYNWKRGRLGSEFLGKRSAVPEQSFPYIKTDRDLDSMTSVKVNSAEEKADDINSTAD